MMKEVFTEKMWSEILEKLASMAYQQAMKLENMAGKCDMELCPISFLEDYEPRFPFPMAADLRIAWDYALGKIKYNAMIPDILYNYCEFVWGAPGAPNLDIPWQWFEKDPMGMLVKATQVRMEVDGGETVNANDLAILLGVSPPLVRKYCSQGRVYAEKRPRKGSSQQEWVIPNEVARDLIKNGLPRKEHGRPREGEE